MPYTPHTLSAEQRQELNNNFWRNIHSLSQQQNQDHAAITQALRKHKVDMDRIASICFQEQEQENFEKHECEMTAIKERAVALVVPIVINNYEMLTEEQQESFRVLKMKLLVLLHEAPFHWVAVQKILREMNLLDCDQRMAEIETPFSQAIDPAERRLYDTHFKVQSAQPLSRACGRGVHASAAKPRGDSVQENLSMPEIASAQVMGILKPVTEDYFIQRVISTKVIRAQKPSFVFFDQQRAFKLMHAKPTRQMMRTIVFANSQFVEKQSETLSFSALQKFNPHHTGRIEGDCHADFQVCMTQLFSRYYEQIKKLAEEQRQVMYCRPVRLFRFLYDNTMRAIYVWRYELMVQKIKTIQYAAAYMHDRIRDIHAWLNKLSTYKQQNQLLMKGFRNQLIQELDNHADEIYRLFEGVKNEYGTMNHDDALVQEMNALPIIADTLSRVQEQLLELKHSLFGTVEGCQVLTALPSESQRTFDQWCVEFAKGQKIPQTMLSLLMIKMSEQGERYYADHVTWFATVQECLLHKLAHERLLPCDGFIKQALRLLLLLKKDSWITAIKKTLVHLPDAMKSGSIVQEALQEIGETVSERLVASEHEVVLIKQAIAKIESCLAQHSTQYLLLERYLKNLMLTVRSRCFASVEELASVHGQEVHIIRHAPYLKVHSIKILNDIVLLSKCYQALDAHQRVFQQLSALSEKDQYVSALVMPVPSNFQLTIG